MGPSSIVHHLGERRLFDREKRTNFVSAGTDDAHDSGKQEQPPDVVEANTIRPPP